MIRSPEIRFILFMIRLAAITGILCSLTEIVQAQLPRLPGNPLGGLQNIGRNQGAQDTIGFEHRDDLKDSITISFQHINSLVRERLDSSLDDFGKVYPLPPSYVTMGNTGQPAYPLLFTPVLQAGWDAGFHAYDIYKYTIENTRFFKTTKPYTQLSYFLASGKEQVVKVLQTQNIKPNWNVGFEYRLISLPGFFKSQNVNHNNYRLFSNYQGKRKRYAAYFVLLGNKLAAAQNGGIQNDSLMMDPVHKNRLSIPVNLSNAVGSYGIFSSKVTTGNFENDFTAFFMHSYDIGMKDSVKINDSTTEYLFYPKLRFQHTIQYHTNTYLFRDINTDNSIAVADSAYFSRWYDTSINVQKGMNYSVQDKWKFVSNDFVLKQFPETRNPGQFIEAGLRLENFSGYFNSGRKSYLNIVLHGEYKNKTRNKKWDADLNGEFYSAGLYAGDFNAYASVARTLNKKLGDIQVSFQNVNRSPSYIFEGNSSFNFNNNLHTKKENITVLSAIAANPRFTLLARNISIANYTYFKNFYQTDQFNGLVNITQFAASTKNKLSRHIVLYSDFLVQQTAGNTPVKVPLFYTRQRLTFEGNFFKNLFLCTGIDVNYNTPYKPYLWSPLMSQFVPQDTSVISNLPQINAFLNFRIKAITFFIKTENLNTVTTFSGLAFMNNSYAAPYYPYPGFILRFGVQWGFVN